MSLFKKIFIFMGIFTLPSLLYSAIALSDSAKKFQPDPSSCQTLLCVRNNIDAIDQQIVHLIGERFKFVKRAGEIKKNNQPVHDEKREQAILEKVKNEAIRQGYPGEIAVAVYKTMLNQSNSYEKHYH